MTTSHGARFEVWQFTADATAHDVVAGAPHLTRLATLRAAQKIADRLAAGSPVINGRPLYTYAAVGPVRA
jgi:hypothetical protein